MALSTLVLVVLTLGGEVQSRVSHGIRDVDFRNYTYCLTRHDHAEPVRLVDGRYRFADDPEVAPGLSLLSVRYGRLRPTEPEQALVTLRYENAGSALHYDFLYVFSLQPDGLQLEYSEKYESAVSVRFAGLSILVRAPYWLATDAHCCPTYDAKYTIKESAGRLKVVALNLARRSVS
jgi:hypothetical protein